MCLETTKESVGNQMFFTKCIIFMSEFIAIFINYIFFKFLLFQVVQLIKHIHL